MNDEHDNSRRWFLRGAAGLTAASVAAALTTAGSSLQAQIVPDRPAVPGEDCCATGAAVSLMSAAFHGGHYFAIASSQTGPGLFALNIDKAQRVNVGSRIKIDMPAGFIVSSLGVARGRLVVSGGVPFVLDSYEVDDEMSEDVRAAMDVIPEGMPTSGRRLIEVMGVRPAVFVLDPPFAQPLVLPEMPQRTFAVATSVAETASGSVMVVVEHSDGVNESYYASAVDVIEESLGGQWTQRAVARALGESGPNHLAVNGDEVMMALNTTTGAKLVAPTEFLASADQRLSVASRILALVPGNTGFSVLASSGNGVRHLSMNRMGAASVDNGAIAVSGDALVGAVPVAGTFGQSILLGRQSARLVMDTSALTGRL